MCGLYRVCSRYAETALCQYIYGLLLMNLIYGCLALDIYVPPLLKTPDGYVIDNTLHASEQDVRLEDFFWTGSGDGAPSFGRRPVKAPDTDHHQHDIFIKTSTVVATIYVDGSLDDGTDNLCLTDCEDDNIPRDSVPSDRRYWLLTVVSGFLTKNDFPIVEKKLAKLYRIAFSRQQSRHFGIDNNTIAEPQNGLNANRKRSIETTTTAPTDGTVENSTDMQSTGNDDDDNELTLTSNEIIDFDSITTAPVDYRMENGDMDDFIPMSRTSLLRVKRGASAQMNSVVHRVSVLVHNITLVSENEDSHPDNQVESLIDKNGPAKSYLPRNQTEIIYSVFVDGKPVLATTAADDMKLLTEQEVADVMEKMIYTKAEPYWKEPQATPLIPSMTTGPMSGGQPASNQLAMIVQNPWMISILVAAIILLVFLLVGLLFMTRAKRIRSAEVKRLTSGRALIGEDSTLEKTQRSRAIEAPGVDNLAYEKDGAANKTKPSKHHKKVGTPTLYFPRPPSTSPSSSNSDSMSSYYKTKAAAADSHHLFNKRTKRVFDLEEYATVAKKHDRKQKRTKHKRKLQNRVGSIEETAQIHSPQSSFVAAISDDVFDTSGEPDSHFYEHIEAFNPNVVSGNYHKNKLLGDRAFGERGALELDIDSPTEAYNREIMHALQRDNRMNDSVSVGSFLSMASIRSFPKCNLPQPLSRVLEPLSVTHLDHSDGPDTARLPRVVDTKRKYVVRAPSSDDLGGLQRSQSDGADPGVIGPVVWEIHKKKLEAQDSLSPLRDPVYTRSRFEGLLEGAIRMYTDETNQHDTEPNPNVPGASRTRDNRGKSAMVPRQKSLITPRTTTSILNRPLTAEPHTTQLENPPTQPPSPYKKAWASGTPSPMVRPLSAGPFHKPDTSSLGRTMEDPATITTSTTQTTILSTAPLIEAIQTELRKFNRYDDSQ